jgi:glycosyltransferase involved in cell wall biosynthesis
MEKPIVSVIIPTHNSTHTIQRCLNSLQKQSSQNEFYEVIIVDDGSKDQTIDIVNSFDGYKLIQIDSCTVAHARNIGVEYAMGDIIAFLDSDCEADQEWIQNIISTVKESKAIVGSIENGSNSFVGWTEYLLEFSAFCEKRQSRVVRWGPTCNMACTKKDFQKTGGFVDVNGSEDVLFGESLGYCNVTMYFIPEIKIQHICRTVLSKVLSHQEFLGIFSTKVRKENPLLPYSFLGQKRSYIPLVFLSKIAARFYYAVKAKKTIRFVFIFPLIILGAYAFCKGAWKGFNFLNHK